MSPRFGVAEVHLRFSISSICFIAGAGCSIIFLRSPSESTSVPINMAGPIRQPINIPNLERYIEANVPEIKTPLEVKQVSAK